MNYEDSRVSDLLNDRDVKSLPGRLLPLLQSIHEDWRKDSKHNLCGCTVQNTRGLNVIYR